jgi:hypothetical protein
MYTAPTGAMKGAQPLGQYPPPTLVDPLAGESPHNTSPSSDTKQPVSYWDTHLTDNGFGLENMHIKQPVPPTAPGESKNEAPHTPWACVPRELDDDESQASSAAQYHNFP